MQTNFTPQQLADPALAMSEKILRKCVHCGFCTATCPTYVTLGNELDSPRGRIYLIKEMLENNQPADRETVLHIDRCLSCLSCVTTCPSGVDYMHLVGHARTHIQQTYRRPLADRAIRWVLSQVLPHPARFRLALRAARLGRPFAGLLDTVPGLKPLSAMLRLAPEKLPTDPGPPKNVPANFSATPIKRVAVLRGCAQSVLDPTINAATMALLRRMGVDAFEAEGAGCCGALDHHMGHEEGALGFARKNVDAWTREIDGKGLDAIVLTTSGCGTTIKDYGHMLRHDRNYGDKAARVSALTKDVSELLTDINLPRPVQLPKLSVAYHAACSLQHGLQVKTAPRQLLESAGFVVVGIREAHLCCGSAGTYNILQSDIATQLRDRKVVHIEATGADVIAAGNLGCITQIGAATTIPIVHTVALLNWAYGGDRPAGL